ncbi:MAG: DUF2892 domain-containing protein [Bacteroidota bacterium]
MKRNMGIIDRTVRVLIALVLIGLFFGYIISGTSALLFLGLSVIFVITSLLSFCPLYLPFGINTCKIK